MYSFVGTSNFSCNVTFEKKYGCLQFITVKLIDPYGNEQELEDLVDGTEFPDCGNVCSDMENYISRSLAKYASLHIATWNLGSTGGKPCSREKALQIVQNKSIWFHLLENYHAVMIQEVTKEAIQILISDEWDYEWGDGNVCIMWKLNAFHSVELHSPVSKPQRSLSTTITTETGIEIGLTNVHIHKNGSKTKGIREQDLNGISSTFVDSEDLQIVGGDFNASQQYVKPFIPDFTFANDSNTSTTIASEKRMAIDHIAYVQPQNRLPQYNVKKSRKQSY